MPTFDEEKTKPRISSSTTRPDVLQPKIESEVLHDVRIDTVGKTYFIDVINNRYGRGIRLTERTASHRNRIVIPASCYEAFMGCLMDAMAASTNIPIEGTPAKA